MNEFGKTNQQEGIEGISSNKIGALSSKGSNHECNHEHKGRGERPFYSISKKKAHRGYGKQHRKGRGC